MGVPHGRCEVLFSLCGGLETASCSFSTPTLASKSSIEMKTMAERVDFHWVDKVWDIGDSLNLFPGATKYYGSRVSALDADGHVTQSAEEIRAVPIAGNALGDALPPEVAVVVSLRTLTAGPRGRGRMYLPGFAANQTDVNGNIDSTARDALAVDMASFFTGLNADVLFGENVGVASNAGGFWTVATEVRVGSVFDAQRRRRAQLVESYKAAPI